MKKHRGLLEPVALLAFLGGAVALLAQISPNEPPPEDWPPPPQFGPGGFGPGGPGGLGRGGFGPPGGGMMGQEVRLVKQFDQDGDKRLDRAERQAAREFITEQRANRGGSGPFGPGGPGGRRGGFGRPGEDELAPEPGPRVAPADVKSYAGVSLYDAQTLRTLFLEFENADWEQELAAFNNTDVEVPARVTVDGGVYTGVGVHFRGASSYMMVGEGRKRSLNLSFDYVLPEQQLGGYRTLNLLNSHEDPSFLRTVLYFHIARTYLPAPQANFVHVVINGESWGVYVNVQQFNKEMIKEWFGTTQGARWKVPGSPGGRGGLNYLGDEVAPYRRLYEISFFEMAGVCLARGGHSRRNAAELSAAKCLVGLWGLGGGRPPAPKGGRSLQQGRSEGDSGWQWPSRRPPRVQFTVERMPGLRRCTPSWSPASSRTLWSH